MPYGEFLAYNVAGGVSWVGSMLLFGYFLGKKIPNAEHYLYPIVIGIIVLSFLPALYELYKARKERK
jgi:membrane-associated protein